MRSFDDFDAWGDAVSGAHLRLACDSVERRTWTIGALDLMGVVLQLASEGGGNLCYGGNTHAGPLLFVPLTHASAHVVNGECLDEESLFAIPRGADFRIHVRKRAHAWCSIALPFDVTASLRASAASARISCGAGAVPRLRRLVQRTAHALLDRPAGSAAHATARDELVAAVIDCIPAGQRASSGAGRPRFDRGRIIRRAMAAIDTAAMVPTATELARSAGVNGRTLLRAFQEQYGVSPKRYLMLRELHLIRRVLKAGSPGEATVADVLARHGIWEFGRFAGRYRRHFGELPSETLKRTRE